MRIVINFDIDHYYWIAAILLMSMALIAFVNVLSRYIHPFFHRRHRGDHHQPVRVDDGGRHGYRFRARGPTGHGDVFQSLPPENEKKPGGHSALFWVPGSSSWSAAYMVQAIYDELTLFSRHQRSSGHPGVDLLCRGAAFFGVRLPGHLSRHVDAAWPQSDREAILMEIVPHQFCFFDPDGASGYPSGRRWAWPAW